jgi:hypothetical protein
METEKIQSLLVDEIRKMKNYRGAYGAQNGEDFSEIADAALSVEDSRKQLFSCIAGAALTTSLVFPNKVQLLKEGMPFNKLMSVLVDDESLNRPHLEMLYLGYRLGRRLQIEEDRILAAIAKE